MQDIRDYIREKKLPLKYFVEKMGYSREHISAVICGRRLPSEPFAKLFTASLESIIAKDINRIQHIEMVIKNPVTWQ